MDSRAPLLVLLASLHAVFGLNEVRWCVITDGESQKCEGMRGAFASANIPPALSCVKASSGLDCAQMISANKADAVTLSGDLIYQAGKLYNLKPVVGEVYDQEIGTSYYAVAVVHKDSTLTITSLKGARSCHTAIRRTAGWNVPIGWLTHSGRMPVVGCDFEQAAADFFDKSCVPGANKTKYNETLCGLCRGSTVESTCGTTEQEKYYDYSGAFRCLAEGTGNVAFVKHSTVAENTDGNNLEDWAKGLQSKNFRLLCMDGSLRNVAEWKRCNLARVPARAVMVRPNIDATEIFNLLNAGQKLFHDGSSTFKMFDSSSYGGKNLLFRDSTTQLTMISNPAYQAWLGDEFLNAMKGLDCDPSSLPSSLRWCTLSTAEIWKCSQMAVEFKKMNMTPSIQCVSAPSTEACMKMIQAKEADVVTLGGQDIYLAGKTYGLVPAAGENYAATDSDNGYYAVAVVKKNSQDAFTINDLKGKRSCHTGYGRTAGWRIPIGALIKRGMIRPQDCSDSNIAKAVVEFFPASCVPGAHQEGLAPELCSLCQGKGPAWCAANYSKEPYFSYSGAFRCLVNGSGEVAFVKHSTVYDNTNGNNKDDWASALKSTDYQLLCLNGALAEVDQFKFCNWGQTPAQAVMVHPDTNKFAISGLLVKAQDYLAADNSTDFSMFNSTAYGGKDLIFKDATERIVEAGDKDTYSKWLGKEYIDSLEGMQCLSGRAEMPVNMGPLLMSIIFLTRFFL
ncbi:melanotransferrin isoform X2 [Pleurodeles waltl]|uniref:melanotransferrin isoform X2 n=1 Tax=Pleurodeles waltl TaxID=8319 RepID=UPI0037094C19